MSHLKHFMLGHLVCRDLSNYLISLECYNDTWTTTLHSVEKVQDKGPESDNRDSVLLMSAMSFMKLQLCYFGNMALRSSLSFAVLGSLLLATIPVIIEKEG